MLNKIDFYKSKEIQKRILEFCGFEEQNNPDFTSEFIVIYNNEINPVTTEIIRTINSKESLETLFKNGFDIHRSFLDKKALIGTFNIEYCNLDNPFEIYQKTEEIFQKLEPVYLTIKKMFNHYKIKPLVLMNSHGYNFSFLIRNNSETGSELEKIGSINDSLIKKYVSFNEKFNKNISIQYAKSSDGLGRVIEFFLGEFFRKNNDITNLPFIMSKVTFGKCSTGIREAITFDISIYAAPVYETDIKCPFTCYKDIKDTKNEIPLLISIPRATSQFRIELNTAMDLRNHLAHANEYAKRITTRIPDMTINFLNIISDYKKSDIFKIHNEFSETIPHKPEEWASTYDRFDTSMLPACISNSLINPNDLLLNPTNIQNICRVLIKIGWSPRHISGLIRTKYERDYHWENTWEKQDPATYSDFYVRLFSEFILTKIDKKEDLNCISTAEKGCCSKPWCGHNLVTYAN